MNPGTGTERVRDMDLPFFIPHANMNTTEKNDRFPRRCVMLTKAELPECPVATTLQLIGNKWKMLILRNLLVRPWRFNEMLRSIPGISRKVLTDNLRALEGDGIITRTVFPEVPPRVEYALSGLGESMRPIIKALETWGLDYQKKVRESE